MTYVSAANFGRPSLTLILRIALIWAAAAWLATNGPALAAEPDTTVKANETAKQQAADFAWFAGLDYPDVKDSQPALIATASWQHHDDDPPRNTYRVGFVLRSDDKRFTVFLPSLKTETFERTPPGTPEHLRIGFEPIDAAKVAEIYRGYLREENAGGIERIFEQINFRINAAAETFLAAYCCSRLGHAQKAAELYRLANDAQVPRGSIEEQALTPSERMKMELADAAMLHAQDALGDEGSFSRAEVAEQFARVAKHFPTSKQAEPARERAAILRRMAEEDREHAERRKGGKPFAELSREEQIAELIFQLREQYGVPEPLGGYNPLDMEAEKKDTPGHKLVEIGYDAIPQLVAAYDDERICRVAYGRIIPDSVIIVGQCASAVIYEITGRSFYAEKNSPPNETDQQRIEAWYAEFRRKGEKRYLQDLVARGEDRDTDAAERLVKRYPNDALPSLLAGVKRTTRERTHTGYIVLIGSLSGDGPVPFLLNELTSGPTNDDRLAAAIALHRRGRPEPVPAMIAEFKRIGFPKASPPHASRSDSSLPSPPPGWAGDRGDADSRFHQNLVLFLAGCGRVDAMDALAENLEQRPIAFRIAAAQAFRCDQEPQRYEFGTASGIVGSRAFADDSPSELRRAALRLLLPLLDDRELRYGTAGPWIQGIPNPRVCHIAAASLHDVDPERYPFDPKTGQDHGTLVIRNLVRQELGLPQIVLPND